MSRFSRESQQAVCPESIGFFFSPLESSKCPPGAYSTCTINWDHLTINISARPLRSGGGGGGGGCPSLDPAD